MKSIYSYLAGSFCLIVTLLLAVGCSEEYKYNTDYSSYNGVKLKVNLVDEHNVLSVKKANATHALTIAVTPEDVFIDSKAYIYEVGDKTIATVSLDGTLSLLKVGETELTVKFRGNHEISTTCTLKVEPTLVSDIKLPEGIISIEEGKTLDLSEFVAALPSTADNQVLRYEVKEGSKDYVEVVEGSIIRGLQEGQATIIVTTTDGSEVSGELTLNVTGKIPVERIDLNLADKLNGKTVPVGQLFNLGSIVKIYPNNASDKTLIYKIVTGNGTVSIDEAGLVKSLAAGDVEIEISAADEFQLATPQTIKFKVDDSQEFFERALWTVDTSIVYANGKNYTTDNTTGNPEHLIDGLTNTYLALTKPGKKYNEEVTPANHVLFFVIDMGSEQEFNTFKYTHRNNNQNFQVFTISMYGSNDNVNFTEIEKNITVGPTSVVTFERPVVLSKCRYIKVELNSFLTSAGINLAVAEFNVAKK